MNYDIAVIGGGAAGLAAAICAAKAAKGRRVAVLEAQDRCGRKLPATGNGRCNIMNANARAEDYVGDAAFIAPALRLYRENYEAFWEDLGVPLALETEGRMYPRVNQASAVLDALRFRLADLGVELHTGFAAEKAEKTEDGYLVSAPNARFSCKRLIVATGGRAGKGLGENESFVRLLTPLRHTHTRVYPALTWLKAPKGLLTGLKGIRLRGEVMLLQGGKTLGRETGEVLFRDDGVSGIAVMQLSLLAAPLLSEGVPLEIRLSLLGEEAAAFLARRAALCPEREIQYLAAGAVNRLLMLHALKRADIAPARRVSTLNKAELQRLAGQMRFWDIPVVGMGGFEEAQVMLGGVSTREFDPETLESRLQRGLYAAGEMLDVTGPCGGYNLEWAWASGMLAGRKAAESL